jgi:hypothetical protein
MCLTVMENCILLIFVVEGAKKSRLLRSLVLMLDSVAVMAPILHFFLAFLLLPPYTGYLFCNVAEPVLFGNRIIAFCWNYDPYQISVASIPLRFLSGISAGVPYAYAIQFAVSISLIEVILGILSIRNFLVMLRSDYLVRRGVAGTAKKLRQLQIFVNFYNDLYANAFFANGIAMADTVVIIFAYCVIKLWKEIPLIGIACLTNVAISGIIVICLSLTVAGTVRVESEKLISTLNKEAVKSGKNASLRVKILLASYAPLKVKVGAVNFVDRSTAGVVLLFSMEQIGSLAMLK